MVRSGAVDGVGESRRSGAGRGPQVGHPSAGSTGNLRLSCLEIAGDPDRVRDWLGNSADDPLEDVDVQWVAPHGTPGIVAAQFETKNGLVRI